MNGESMNHYKPIWESIDSRPIPKWFSKAKFGIFIHWGVYSVPAFMPVSSERYGSYAEWYYAKMGDDGISEIADFHNKNYGEDHEYREFAKDFKAELFDPDAWADLFRRSGAKYVVLTSKHHDGYCLWPTKSPYKKNWNSMDIGPERDLVGDLTKAVRKKGLKMGLYYSILEWETHPTQRVEAGRYIKKTLMEKYGIPIEKYVDGHLLFQLKELVNEYKPALIFSDGGEWDYHDNYWKTKEFLAWLYNHAPNKDEVVVNDRWCKDMGAAHGDYFSSEYQDATGLKENHPWEESRGVGGSYGYNRAENIDDYCSSKELIHELIDIVSRGGNLLLNVGPTADGRIPVIMQQRLIDIGNWLDIYGEAIYETHPWEKSRENKKDFLFFTKKGNLIYAICTKWPENEIRLEFEKEAENISLVGSSKNINWASKPGEIRIQIPNISPGEMESTFAFVFRIEMRP